MLNCFNEKYDFPVKKATDIDSLPIGDIAEELWRYSTLVDLLTEPEDAEYLGEELQNTKTNIEKMLRKLYDRLPQKDIDWLTDMSNKVFRGKRVDDILFNEIIETFVRNSTEK